MCMELDPGIHSVLSLKLGVTQGEASGPPESVGRLKHLPGGGSRSSGMPPVGYADPIMNDGLGFHLDAQNYSWAHLVGVHRAHHPSHQGK
jgi:hypothetical protein